MIFIPLSVLNLNNLKLHCGTGKHFYTKKINTQVPPSIRGISNLGVFILSSKYGENLESPGLGSDQ